jgi:hypothetical protein
VAEVEFNPYASTCKKLEDEIAEKRERFAGLGEALARHARFDETEANSEIVQIKQKVLDLSTVLADLDRRIDGEREVAATLAEQARVGWDPRRWFSRERALSKQSNVDKVESVRGLEAQRQACADEQASLVKGRKERLDELSTYRKTDASILQAEREQLTCAIKDLEARIAQVLPLRERVEEAIAAPQAEYKKLSARHDQLASDIDRAEVFDRKLHDAASSYERAMLHQECERLFGEASPARLRSRLRSELRPLERDMEKLRMRLKEVGHRAAREIRKLVFDGNNMCFEREKFIGLGPVKAAVRDLAGRYEMIIVFDASIGPLAKMSPEAIALEVGGAAKVHIVPTGSQADETVLEVAVGNYAYVVSNDRFADFMEKPPVREARVIRHNIVDGRVLIHDLRVNAKFAGSNLPA